MLQFRLQNQIEETYAIWCSSQFFMWKFEIHLWVIGRPAGTVETKFTEEERNRIVEAVDETKVSSVISTKGLSDIADLFNKAGVKDAVITRNGLEENAYILQPLFQASPIHTIHIDSFLWLNGIWRTMFFDWCPCELNLLKGNVHEVVIQDAARASDAAFLSG